MLAFAPARIARVDGLSTSAELSGTESMAAKFGLAAQATRQPGKGT